MKAFAQRKPHFVMSQTSQPGILAGHKRRRHLHRQLTLSYDDVANSFKGLHGVCPARTVERAVRSLAGHAPWWPLVVSRKRKATAADAAGHVYSHPYSHRIALLGKPAVAPIASLYRSGSRRWRIAEEVLLGKAEVWSAALPIHALNINWRFAKWQQAGVFTLGKLG